jgi:hypothetical protein
MRPKVIRHSDVLPAVRGEGGVWSITDYMAGHRGRSGFT